MTSADPAAPGYVQVVRSAGMGRETRWILLACALVLALSAAGVLLQRTGVKEQGAATHQLDLATELSAAEQGLYTDLQALHEEWRATGSVRPPPAPAYWADEGWPPFVQDSTANARGARHWQLLQSGGLHAYLGQPDGRAALVSNAAESEAAPRSLLWRLPAPDAPAPAFTLWLHAQPVVPAVLDDAALIAQGWKQVLHRASPSR